MKVLEYEVDIKITEKKSLTTLVVTGVDKRSLFFLNYTYRNKEYTKGIKRSIYRVFLFYLHSNGITIVFSGSI